MTRGYITPQGDYYEGDRAHALDTEVPQRPSTFHNWNGSAWVLDQAAKDAAEAAAQRLVDFDAAISGDANLQAFKTMTKADFDVWWSANVNTGAQAIAVLKKLAWLIIRRVL